MSVFLSRRRPLIATLLIALATLGLSACHATQAADDGVNWLSNGLSDLDDAVQRSLDRQ